MTAYDHGRQAALAGRFRVLANPASEDEEREWYRGFDSVTRVRQSS